MSATFSSPCVDLGQGFKTASQGPSGQAVLLAQGDDVDERHGRRQNAQAIWG